MMKEKEEKTRNRRQCWRFLPAMLGVLLWVTSGISEGTNQVNITLDEVEMTLRTEERLQMDEAVDRWHQSPLYQRMSILEVLSGKLSQKDRRPLNQSAQGEERYDLNSLAGRAAWMMDRLMHVQLPPIPQNASPEDLNKTQKTAKQKVAEYRREALARQMMSIQKLSVEQLKKTYAGRIVPGINEKATESMSNMSSLLRDWFPLGRDLQVLEAIVGTKAEPVQGGFSFRFDTGFGGLEYFFTVDDGKIETVVLKGLN